MARGRGSPLMKRDADKIATKLRATIKEGANHTIAFVWHDSKLVTSFLIRRGTHARHGHLPRQLFLSKHDTLDLARCHIARETYFELIATKVQ